MLLLTGNIGHIYFGVFLFNEDGGVGIIDGFLANNEAVLRPVFRPVVLHIHPELVFV